MKNFTWYFVKVMAVDVVNTKVFSPLKLCSDSTADRP